MTKARLLILLIVAAHWFVGIVHLFFAAQVLPAPNNHVSLLAVTFITLVHWAVALGLWKLTQKPVLWVSLIFFLAAMSADLYEHFLHASLNNICIPQQYFHGGTWWLGHLVRGKCHHPSCSGGPGMLTGNSEPQRREKSKGRLEVANHTI